MDKTVEELIERFQSGTFTDEDSDAAAELISGMQSGEIPVPSVVGSCDWDSGASVRKAIESEPGGEEAINAVPILAELVNAMDRMQAQLDTIVAQTAEVMSFTKSLAGGGVSYADPEKVRVGKATAEAILKAIEAIGSRVGDVEEVVHRRAYSGNPARVVRKSVVSDSGNWLRDKSDGLVAIRKAVERNQISEDDAAAAFLEIDQASLNGIPVGQVVQRYVG